MAYFDSVGSNESSESQTKENSNGVVGDATDFATDNIEVVAVAGLIAVALLYHYLM